MNNALSMLASRLPERADAAVIASAENKRYFTGFPSRDGYLLVTKEKAFFVTDPRYEEAAAIHADGCEVISCSRPADEIGKLAGKYELGHILLEGSCFTVNEAEHIGAAIEKSGAVCEKSSALDTVISGQRIIKTSAEIEQIICAQKITEQALNETLKLIREGITEREIELELEYRMKKYGAEGVSFDLIVITGKKTSMPHGVPGNDPIRPGDFITFDIGSIYGGYHSDMTRTYAFGYVNEKQRRIYETVRKAQQLAADAVCSGIYASEVDRTAREYIRDAGFGEYFGHSTGHGVGLEIHEAPSVSASSETILSSGMVITIEPGIYLPGEFGVRIEDMVAVTNNGCINLVALPKELIIL